MLHDTESKQSKKSLIAIFLTCFFAIAALLGFSYYYATKDSMPKEEQPLSFDTIQPKAQEVLYLHTTRNDSIMQDFEIQNSMELEMPLHDSLDMSQANLKADKDSIKRHKKPKVAIIIDDLANKRDIKNFESLGLRLNLSLFPKQFFSKHNPAIAKTLPFYMIHLPLEAHNFEQEGVLVLRTTDTPQTIESHIAQIKHDFPNLRYINNHTGSRYTEDKRAMELLLSVLEKHNIIFVDSRTSAKSAVKDIFAAQKKLYLARNVFLDNEPTMQAISKQLENALHMADKRGYVVAIGHPKEATYKVLKQYRARLLRDYDMVYISELDAFLQQRGIKNTDTALREFAKK